MKERLRKRPPIPSLINKINNLNTTERIGLAQKCGTSIGNLRQIAYGFGGVSPKLARLIVDNSDCDITIKDLIPELL